MNTSFGEPGFGNMLGEMPAFFKIFGGLVIVLVVGGFLYAIVKGLSTWTSNNASELLQRPARVVDKRTKVWGGSGDSSASTSYYITFEFEDHARLELQVRSQKFGLITVGDRGELVYQGTRFKEFNRVLGA